MLFGSLLYLIGSVAASIPFILHMRRKNPKNTVGFPSLRFLREATIIKKKRGLPRNLLLLLLRMLIFILLASAFSLPFFPDYQRKVDSLRIVLYDDSYSMDSKDYRHQMEEQLSDLLATATDKNPMMLGLVRDTVLWQNNFAAATETLLSWFHKNKSYRYSSDLSTAVREADQRLAISGVAKREIIILSDQQARPWRNLDWNQKLSPGITLNWKFPRQHPLPENIAIVSASVNNNKNSRGQRILDVHLRNYGLQEQPALLKVVIGEKTMLTTNLVLPARSDVHKEFKIQVAKNSGSQGCVFLEADDPILADNQRFFSFNPTKAGHIYISDLDDGFDFIQVALNLDRENPRTRILPYQPKCTLDDLRSAHYILLQSPTNIAKKDYYALKQAVQQGANLVITGTWASENSAYLSDFGFFSKPRSKTPSKQLGMVDFDHPLFSDYQKIHSRSLFSLVFHSPEEIRGSTAAETLASFDDHSPAIIETQYGLGKAFLLAFDFKKESTDWLLSPSFLPFMQSLFEYTGKEQIPILGYYLDGKPITNLGITTIKNLTTQKPYPLENGFFIPSSVGNYQAGIGNAVEYFSVNVVPEEGEPALLEDSFSLKALFNDQSIEPQNITSFSVEEELENDHRKTEIAMKLFLIVFLLLLFELLLANRTSLRTLQA